MWFWYRLQYRLWYRPKLLANMGFGIGPKPEKWFWSLTTHNPVLIVGDNHVLNRLGCINYTLMYPSLFKRGLNHTNLSCQLYTPAKNLSISELKS